MQVFTLLRTNPDQAGDHTTHAPTVHTTLAGAHAAMCTAIAQLFPSGKVCQYTEAGAACDHTHCNDGTTYAVYTIRQVALGA